MHANHLRRTAEHLWNAWLDLNYAAADLSTTGQNHSIGSEIGTRAAELRDLAEKLERLAAANHTAAPSQRMRRPPES